MVVGMVAEGQRSCRLSACAVQAPRLLTSYLIGQVATRVLQNLCQILFHQVHLFGKIEHCVCWEVNVGALLLGTGRIFGVTGMLFVLAWLNDSSL